MSVKAGWQFHGVHQTIRSGPRPARAAEMAGGRTGARQRRARGVAIRRADAVRQDHRPADPDAERGLHLDMGGNRSLARRLGGVRHLQHRRQRHDRAPFRPPRPPPPRGRDGGLFRPRAAPADELSRQRPHRAAAQDHDRGRLGHVRRVAVVLPRAFRRAGVARRAAAGDADRQLAARRHPARSWSSCSAFS